MNAALVSIYPPKGSTHERSGGVASYTKNLAISLSHNSGCNVIVFANRIHTFDTSYQDKGVTVFRCWSKNILYPFHVFRKLLSTRIDIIHIQHEIYLYGDLSSAIVFPILLLLVRLLRKPVIVTLHGVVPISKINRSFLKSNRIYGNSSVMKLGLALLTKLTILLSTSVVVHEKKFKRVLLNEYHCRASKILVIHHGIEENSQQIGNDEAKEILGLSGKNVILFFGYITGYKDVMLLVESMEFLETLDCVMIIAGSGHPRLVSDSVYQEYLRDLKNKALAVSNARIIFTGFVVEGEVPLYYSAADLLVFPYSIVISSSGPLCLAISYRRPFLISKDFELIGIRDLTFDLQPKELATKIMRFFENRNIQSEALECIERLRSERSWQEVANETSTLYRSTLK